MKHDYGGQRRNMEDRTMVETLRAQAEAIWPLERPLLEYLARGRVLDLACGTGEILRRLREEQAPAFCVGADLFRGHLARAPKPVVQADAYRLPFPDGAFDLVLVRHVLQAVEDPVAFLREARRVLRASGVAHLLVEDYAALLFDTDDYDAADLFRDVSRRFRPRGTDLYQGRRAWRHLREAGFSRIEVAPVLVDTTRAPRETLARIYESWRDGYAATLADVLGVDEAEVVRRFDAAIASVRDETRYHAWLLLALRATA